MRTKELLHITMWIYLIHITLHKSQTRKGIYTVGFYVYKAYKQAKLISGSFGEKGCNSKGNTRGRGLLACHALFLHLRGGYTRCVHFVIIHQAACLRCLCFLGDCIYTHTQSFQHPGKGKVKYFRALALWASVVNGE